MSAFTPPCMAALFSPSPLAPPLSPPSHHHHQTTHTIMHPHTTHPYLQHPIQPLLHHHLHKSYIQKLSTPASCHTTLASHVSTYSTPKPRMHTRPLSTVHKFSNIPHSLPPNLLTTLANAAFSHLHRHAWPLSSPC